MNNYALKNQHADELHSPFNCVKQCELGTSPSGQTEIWAISPEVSVSATFENAPCVQAYET
jgi:hypothetical protein